MEGWTAIYNGFGIFCHFTVQYFICIFIIKCDRIKVAGSKTASTSYTVFGIYRHFLCCFIKYQSTIGTFTLTAFAATTDLSGNMWGSGSVLFCFSCTGTASHTDIFNGSAKSGHLMSFEVCQADKYICIHNCPSDFCGFYIFTALDRHFYVIGSL